ncbi:MAG TPA: hypothetical protein ENK15_05330 [Thermopetrobacter sp.]|nr:hypothetical protein [Thermopetrobacter sp.]
MTRAQWSAFFGWMTVLNIGLLLLAWLFVWLLGPWGAELAQRLLSVPPATMQDIYVRWLAMYELFIYAFNLVPWLALKLVRPA